MKIFISHSSSDKKFVRKLKEDLKENDFNTWVDEDELDYGDSLYDKLDTALEDSSHFVIVLSNASVKSEWVQYELEKALMKRDSYFRSKIIPVKYKNCEVPIALKHLLYADLSSETREVVGDKVLFAGAGYLAFLDKLFKSIRNSEMMLTSDDKADLKKEITIDPSQPNVSPSQNIVRSIYVVIGYRSKETREKYASAIIYKSALKIRKDEIKPVLLPPLLEYVFKDLKIGDEIIFTKNFSGDESGHFAGYRKDDLGLTIDFRIRKGLQVKKGHRYNVEVEIGQRKINFISK